MNTIRLILGDSLIKLKELESCSVDYIVSDPPYGLEFMGDAPWKKSGWQSGGGFSKPGIGERHTKWPSFSATSKYGASNPTCATCGGRARGKKKCYCEEPKYKKIGKRRKAENEGLPDDVTGSGMVSQLIALQQWCFAWSSECFRILKPNGVIKAFSGTRTFHRMSKAMREAGFVDFEVHAWTYGSGFPKSMDVSKALDKQAGAEREVVGRVAGMGKQNPEWNGTAQGRAENSFKPEYDATATDAARQWSGWGTALKPAWEPIVVARKPL
jgi:site-specific DNA-methyltransferase (adenine-specific)